jgi:arsenate reductase-like glutaredoxin family protein
MYARRPVRAILNIQLFGTKKCADSRKAERFFTERGNKVHVVDLAQKGMSAGELRNVAGRVGGMEALIDRGGKRYIDKGLKYAAPTGPRIEKMLVEDPLLLRTPIVRCDGRATVGYAPEIWQTWVDGIAGEG